ncbi:MAG: dTDP-4-dehydrorhamnose reductase [Chlamydiota bacterium]
MKIWIVGAKGLLGSNLKALCEKQYLPFFATGKDDVPVTCLEALQRCAEENAPTHIVNCAAFTDVDGAEKLSKEAYAVNALGAENVAHVAREYGTKLVHISTDYVFSGCESTSPFLETDPCQPVGVYAQSKWEGELRLLEEFSTACIVRTSWLFGSKGKNFISGLLNRLRELELIKAVDDQTGRATYCKDLSEVILALLCHSGVFHFANEGELTRYQIALDMKQFADEQGVQLACKEIVPVKGSDFPSCAARPSYSVLSTKKIESLFGKKPRSWSTVLQEFVGHAAQ